MSVFFIHPMRPGCALFFEAIATPGISPRTYHLVMFQCPGLLWLFAFVTQSLELLSCSGHCCLQPQFPLSVHRCIVFCFYLKHFQINTKVENSATSPPPPPCLYLVSTVINLFSLLAALALLSFFPSLC